MTLMIGGMGDMKIYPFITNLLLVISLAACNPSGSHTKVLRITMEDISASPEKFDGKRVQIRGTFNECASLTCMICQSETPVDAYSGEHACMGVSFKAQFMETYARHSTAIIDAEYDSSAGGFDRASPLKDAIVVEIIEHRPASKGYISMYGVDSLVAPDHETSEALKSAFKKQNSKQSTFPIAQPEFTFVFDMSRKKASSGYKRIEAEGGVCICVERENCKDIWPTLEGHVYNLPIANPYYCLFAEKTDGEWRYPIPQ